MSSRKILGDYLSLITYGFTNPMSDASIGPWKVTAKDITNGRINYSTARKTTQEEFDELLTSKSKPQINDILLTKDGTLGRVAVVDRNGICINQSVALLRPNSNIHPQYLYYLLLSPRYQQKMISEALGTTIKHIYISKVKKMDVCIPEIKKQNRVVKILQPLDKKIDINECHIINLEQSLQAIYQSWFSEFNYPDATNQMQSSIPIGWNNSNVFDNVNEIREKNKDDLDYPVLSVVKEGVFKLSDDVFTKQVYSKSLTNYKIVRRNQVGYNPARANIGSIAMLTEFEAGLVSPIYIVFEMKDTITPTFFNYYMKQPMFAEGIKHHAIGTTRQNFPFEAFKMFPMIIPPMELQKQFEEIAMPIEQKITKLKEENTVIAEIRDTLLPKLMSGELPVEVGEA